MSVTLLVYYKDINYSSGSDVKFVAFTNMEVDQEQTLLEVIKKIHLTSYTTKHETHFDKRYIIEIMKIREGSTNSLKRVKGHFDFKGNHLTSDSIFYLNHHLRRLIKDIGWVNSQESLEEEFILDLNDDSSSCKRTRHQKMLDEFHKRKENQEINRRKSLSEILSPEFNLEGSKIERKNDNNFYELTGMENEIKTFLDSSGKLQSNWEKILEYAKPIHLKDCYRKVSLTNMDLVLMCTFKYSNRKESENLKIVERNIWFEGKKQIIRYIMVKETYN